MTLRFKFTIFFSLLISLVTVIALTVIYFLYDNTRREDFRQRLFSQAAYSYDSYYKLPVDKRTLMSLDENQLRSIPNMDITIFDKYRKPVYQSDEVYFQPTASLFKEAVNNNSAYLKQKNREVVAIYMHQYNISGFCNCKWL